MILKLTTFGWKFKKDLKILIVDDDLTLHHLLCRFLTYNGYITEAAPDCGIAKQKLKEFEPNLIISDINLPDDTGLYS